MPVIVNNTIKFSTINISLAPSLCKALHYMLQQKKKEKNSKKNMITRSLDIDKKLFLKFHIKL